MSRIKSWWPNFLFLLIIVLGFGLRIYKVQIPQAYVFDEVYHVPTIKMIVNNDQRAYEWWHLELEEEREKGAYVDWLHPPLAKLVQAASIVILGDNAWGWRLPSVLAGTLLIIVVYKFALALWPKKYSLALGASLLTAIDGLGIAQSRIAMNDIFVTLWTTMGLWCYYQWRENKQKKYLWPLAIITGLALATKWSGALILIFICLWEFAKYKFDTGVKLLIFLSTSAMIVYLLSYTQLFWQKPFSHFIDLHANILNYQINLEADHPYSSSPWFWPLGFKPVYLFASDNEGVYRWNRPFYPIWYLGLGALVLSSVLLIINIWSKRVIKCMSIDKKNKEKLIFVLMAYFAFWLPWTLSPRIMYFHHYLPATPMIWLITSWLLTKIWQKE